MAGYCSRLYRSASSLLSQKLNAKIFGSVSDTRRVSSTNPACFFKIGSTFSLMVLASSRAFPDLGVTSTVRENMGNTPFALVLNRRRSRYRSKLTGSSGVSLGWSRSCDQLLDHHVFGPEPSSETVVRCDESQLPNFLAGH